MTTQTQEEQWISMSPLYPKYSISNLGNIRNDKKKQNLSKFLRGGCKTSYYVKLTDNNGKRSNQPIRKLLSIYFGEHDPIETGKSKESEDIESINEKEESAEAIESSEPAEHKEKEESAEVIELSEPAEHKEKEESAEAIELSEPAESIDSSELAALKETKELANEKWFNMLPEFPNYKISNLGHVKNAQTEHI